MPGSSRNSAGLRSELRAVVMVWAVAVASLAGCAKIDMPAHLKPLSNDMMRLMAAKDMKSTNAIFIRIFKAESELEVWKQRSDGYFHHLKTYPVCAWSGDLGPKIEQGDKQAPEGFYTVNRYQLNPNSKFHLSFDLGFPNAYDRSHNRTGSFIMIHGDCSSAGCYAMTDTWIEEIYALAREAFIGGQTQIHVHAFPFRFTDENMKRYAKHEHVRFWKKLKEGYDYFNVARVPPEVLVCGKRYVVNATTLNGASVAADQPCPKLMPLQIPVYAALPEAETDAEEIITAPGPKKRVLTVDGEIETVGSLATSRYAKPPPPRDKEKDKFEKIFSSD